MTRIVLIGLLALNVLLFIAWRGGFGGVFTDARDPGRINRQINAEQVRIVPAPPPAP